MDALPYLEYLVDIILEDERVREALPDPFYKPIIMLYHNDFDGNTLGAAYGPRYGVPYDGGIIRFKVWGLADMVQTKCTLRHELAHIISYQKHEELGHGYGFKNLLTRLYGNQNDFYYYTSPLINQAIEAFKTKRANRTTAQTELVERILHGNK